jgi:succinate dehydrogenase / fumarate reductase cytochrome b subunit
VSETSSPKLLAKNRRAFLLRKLHSLSGVAPVGGFMVFHLWENSTALQGQERFDESVAGINKMPYLAFLEWGLILLPLLFHAGYGIKLALESKPNVGRYTFTRNWMYTLQRVTGLLAFAYICFHLYEYWWQKVAGKLAPEQFYSALCQNMSHSIGPVPVVALVYILGIAACVFHFANGLWGFCFSWGITVSRRSQRLAATAFGVLGLVLFALGANTVIYFSTGASLLGSAPNNARTCASVNHVSAQR